VRHLHCCRNNRWGTVARVSRSLAGEISQPWSIEWRQTVRRLNCTGGKRVEKVSAHPRRWKAGKMLRESCIRSSSNRVIGMRGSGGPFLYDPVCIVSGDGDEKLASMRLILLPCYTFLFANARIYRTSTRIYWLDLSRRRVQRRNHHLNHRLSLYPRRLLLLLHHLRHQGIIGLRLARTLLLKKNQLLINLFLPLSFFVKMWNFYWIIKFFNTIVLLFACAAIL